MKSIEMAIYNIMITAIWAAVAIFFRHWWITLFSLLCLAVHNNSDDHKEN